jgi:8-oxo-dGTP pyrophosphatase MutT (NUDIX family)
MSKRRAFSASVFLTHQGRVLLVHHKRFDQWLPVGGELEFLNTPEGPVFETPLECAMREVREETGLALDEENFWPVSMPGQPRGFMGYEEHDAGSKGLHMNFVFVARAGTSQITLSDEHHAYAWVNPKQVEDRSMPPNVRWCLSSIDWISG